MIFYEIIHIIIRNREIGIEKKTDFVKGSEVMTSKTYKNLNLQQLQSKPSKTICSKEALSDVQKIEWSKEVIEGRRKVTITGNQKK